MRGKTRPGVDRITKLQLQAEHTYASAMLKSHNKLCMTCQRAEGNVRARCADWWQLAKAEHRTARRLRAYTQPETVNMTPMLTEEQCDPPPF